MTEHQREQSNYLYELAMRLTDKGAKGVDDLIRELCKLSGCSYPPEQKKVSQHLLTLETH